MSLECSDWLSPFTGIERERGRAGGGEVAGPARARQAALLAVMGAKMEAS